MDSVTSIIVSGTHNQTNTIDTILYGPRCGDVSGPGAEGAPTQAPEDDHERCTIEPE